MLMMRKKQIIIVALSLMIVVAAYLNWNYGGNSNVDVASVETAGKRLGEAEFVSNNDVEVQETNSTTTDDSYFKDARLNREKARSDKKDMLNEIINNEESSKEAVKQAEDSLVNMAGYVEKESNIENQLIAKQFNENMVFITDDSVTVTVKTQGLQPADTAKITDIVVSETKFPADKIKIVEVK